MQTYKELIILKIVLRLVTSNATEQFRTKGRVMDLNHLYNRLFTYLGAQLEINDYNGNQGATHCENNEDEEQKSKQVIKLIFPDRLK